MIIESACMIVAIRALIGDPSWAPSEIVAEVIANNGFPQSRNPDLERLAPVRVFMDCRISIVGDAIEIASDQECVTVRNHDRIAVSRITEPGRAHVECITAAVLAEIVGGIVDGRRLNNIIALIVARETAGVEVKTRHLRLVK